MVFPAFDRTERYEGGAFRGGQVRGARRQRCAAKPGRYRRWNGQGFLVGKLRKGVQRRPAVANHARSGLEDSAHSLAMDFGLAGATELRMRDRNEVVNEIDRAHPGFAQPRAKALAVEAGVPDIQIKSAVGAA